MHIIWITDKPVEALLPRVIIRFLGLKVDGEAAERQEDEVVVFVVVAGLVNCLTLF